MIVVTDHALLRWLERVHGVDVEALRKELQEQVEGVMTPGMRQFHTDKCTFCFQDFRLTTVLHPRRRHEEQQADKIRRMRKAKRRACGRDEIAYEREQQSL